MFTFLISISTERALSRGRYFRLGFDSWLIVCFRKSTSPFNAVSCDTCAWRVVISVNRGLSFFSFSLSGLFVDFSSAVTEFTFRDFFKLQNFSRCAFSSITASESFSKISSSEISSSFNFHYEDYRQVCQNFT